ncbi:ECF transporter S component [Ornithinibacillus sp. 4-3]|uniref:ECF transporter S component n=1 Tax=Ornithinibacillus sp. 4-3 TaxID=3231488 RepID=A0AB39HLW3_9BACI
MNTYKITLLAFLAAIAIVGRNLFVFIPGFQPATVIIMIAGLMLGSIAAVILALLITILSNLTLGMGMWAIAQIISWGLIGLLSGLLGRYFKKIPIYILVILSIIAGYFYGFVISLMTYQVTGHFWPYYVMGLSHDTNHAIGNGIFMALLYPVIAYLIKRYASNYFHQ